MLCRVRRRRSRARRTTQPAGSAASERLPISKSAATKPAEPTLTLVPDCPFWMGGGWTSRDIAIARLLCLQLKDNDQVETIRVNDTILKMQIGQKLYRALLSDRVSSNQFVRRMMVLMEKGTGNPYVSVWIYVNDEKVITGERSMWSSDKTVTYLDE